LPWKSAASSKISPASRGSSLELDYSFDQMFSYIAYPNHVTMRDIFCGVMCFAASTLVHGQFSAPHPIEEQRFMVVLSVAFADVDGDLAQDVLLFGTTSLGKGLSWQRNQGDGTFGPLIWLEDLDWSFNVWVMVAADVDNDSDNDVLVCGTGIYCLADSTHKRNRRVIGLVV
jgi:hypothetical protein